MGQGFKPCTSTNFVIQAAWNYNIKKLESDIEEEVLTLLFNNMLFDGIGESDITESCNTT